MVSRGFSSTSCVGFGSAGFVDETLATSYLILLSTSLNRLLFSTFPASIQNVITIITIISALSLLQKPPVSLPGGPRQDASRIRREPVWPSKDWTFDSEFTFVGAAKSHKFSNMSFGDEIKLSGEASGRQTWWNNKNVSTFTFNPAKNPNTSDRVFREQQIKSWHMLHEEEEEKDGYDDVEDSKGHHDLRFKAKKATIKALKYFRMLQCEDGHWAGDYGGPHFLLPGLVIVWYVTGKAEHVLSKKQCNAMSHYLRVHQQIDGGWGRS